MACVTLKRPLDFDPLEVLHSPNRPPTKRRRCTPIKNVDSESGKSSKGRKSLTTTDDQEHQDTSVFNETPITRDEIATNLKKELKRLKHGKNILIRNPSGSENKAKYSSLPKTSISEDRKSTSVITSISAISSQFSSTSISNSLSPEKGDYQLSTRQKEQMESTSDIKFSNPFAKDKKSLTQDKSEKKMFTLKEMTLICEKMCQERTDAVRQEYDKILHQKLSEQYDAFVKFIDHQIQQRFNESQLPSYLS